MTLKLSDNIRSFRKQRSLTQEQLAEVLGVTTGAVYKWEAGLSIPDLSLIVEMADFFDTSMDVLIGYEMKNNRVEETLNRIREYIYNRDYTMIFEAEKALKKYPNHFRIVHSCARMYHIFGLELADKKKLRRSLELYEKARLLLNQNTDPLISEFTIYGEIADVYLSLGENEKAVEIFKKHNSAGLYNDRIGLTLATNGGDKEESLFYLSEALIASISSIVRTITGYVNVFLDNEKFEDAEAILLWLDQILSGLKYDHIPNSFDKLNGTFLSLLAHTQLALHKPDAAKQTLLRARELALCFDAAPDYATNAMRFMHCEELSSTHDDLGATAVSGIEKTISSLEDQTLTNLWKEILKNETETA